MNIVTFTGFCLEILKANSKYPDQMPRFAASELACTLCICPQKQVSDLKSKFHLKLGGEWFKNLVYFSNEHCGFGISFHYYMILAERSVNI